MDLSDGRVVQKAAACTVHKVNRQLAGLDVQ